MNSARGRVSGGQRRQPCPVSSRLIDGTLRAHCGTLRAISKIREERDAQMGLSRGDPCGQPLAAACLHWYNTRSRVANCHKWGPKCSDLPG